MCFYFNALVKIADMLVSRRVHNDLTTLSSLLFRLKRTCQRWSHCEILRSTKHTSDIKQGALPKTDADFNWQAGNALYNLKVIHFLLNIDRTLNSLPASKLCILPYVYFWNVLRLGPHNNHGVAHKLYDVAAIFAQVSAHAFHISIDAERKLFITSDSLGCARFANFGETADVGKHTHGLHLLQLWKLRSHSLALVLSRNQLLENQARNILIEQRQKVECSMCYLASLAPTVITHLSN